MSSEQIDDGNEALFSGQVQEKFDQEPLDDLDMDGVGGDDDGDSWDSLPPFATAAHKQLFQKVRAEKQRLEQLTQVARENAERVSIMSEHVQNVKQELVHTQASPLSLDYHHYSCCCFFMSM
jgi:hypothetical protein